MRGGGAPGGARRMQVKAVFASGTDDLNALLIERMRGIFPELPLWVVSEFPPEAADVRWVRYQVDRPLLHNLARCRAAFRGVSIRLAAVMLMPNVPLRRLRLLALLLAPLNVMAFNENLTHFMLRPRSIPAMLRHALWRAGNYLRWRAQGGAAQIEVGAGSPDPAAAHAQEPAVTYAGQFTGKPRVAIASPYPPFPLSHGGAVRMYNLMRRAAKDFDLILISFTETGEPPLPELREICAQIVFVRRVGSHLHARGMPEMVAEFDSPIFRPALRRAVAEWGPEIVQLEFTHMAQYAAGCAPARTILVEHDITFDLHKQLLALKEDWDLRRELNLWKRFETEAWRKVDRVVVMSERDRSLAAGAAAAVLPNGVDIARFQPSLEAPEARRLLFIGSFAHLPNLLALQFFLDAVWPLLAHTTLHIIAGIAFEEHLARSRMQLPLEDANIELSGFVADVRPAYRRAAVAIAPLRASAGTNIKILEAMAMGKAVVATAAGVNGLDLAAGEDYILAETAADFAAAIEDLLSNPEKRAQIGAAARRRVERHYDWDAIAAAQAELYRGLVCARS